MYSNHNGQLSSGKLHIQIYTGIKHSNVHQGSSHTSIKYHRHLTLILISKVSEIQTPIVKDESIADSDIDTATDTDQVSTLH